LDFLKVFGKVELKKLTPLHKKLVDATQELKTMLEKLELDVDMVGDHEQFGHKCQSYSVKWGIFTILAKDDADKAKKLQGIKDEYFQQPKIMQHIQQSIIDFVVELVSNAGNQPGQKKVEVEVEVEKNGGEATAEGLAKRLKKK
jgi:hypothetical protein